MYLKLRRGVLVIRLKMTNTEHRTHKVGVSSISLCEENDEQAADEAL